MRKDEPQTLDVGQMIETGNWSGYQKLVLFLTVLAVIFDGFDNQVVGFAMPMLLADWKVERAAMAPVLSAALFGMTMGSVLAGWIGDRWGRRRTLIGCVMLFGVMTIAVAMISSVASLTILRFAAGIGLGGAMPNAAALISEYTPRNRRLLAVSFAAVCVPLGGVFGGIISAHVLPALGWKALFLIGGGAPILFAFVLSALLPESPKFLARIGDPHQHLPVLLARMRKPLPAGAVSFVDGTHAGAAILDRNVFNPAYRWNSTALWIAFFACLFAVYSTVNWLPTLMMDQGFSLATASYALTWYNVGGVFAAIGGGWLGGRLDSKMPVIGLAMIGLLAAGFLATADLRSSVATAGVMTALIVWGASSAGSQSVLTALASASYPTCMRATGVGTAIGFGRMGGILGATLSAAYLSRWGAAGFFGIQAVAMTVVAGATLAFRYRRGQDEAIAGEGALARPPHG